MKKKFLPNMLFSITVIAHWLLVLYYPEPTMIVNLLAAVISAEVMWIYFRDGRVSKNGLKVIAFPLIYGFLYPFIVHNSITLFLLGLSQVVIVGMLCYVAYFTRSDNA